MVRSLPIQHSTRASARSLYRNDQIGMTAWSGPLLLLIGLSSWLAVNSVFSQLGLLIANTPEGAALPSVLTVALQIPNVVALAIGWFASSTSKRKTGADSRSRGTAAGHIDNLLVLGCIGLASIAQVLLATGLWKSTSVFAGGRRSVLLVVLVAVAGIADTSSSVLFWPLAARPAYTAKPGDLPPTVWLAIGEGLSSVIPNALALVQFAGLRDGQTPRLSEEVFFACMACVHLVSLAAASALICGEQGTNSCCATTQPPHARAGAPHPAALPSLSASTLSSVSGKRHLDDHGSESLAAVGIHPDPHRTGLLAADSSHILECASVPLGSGSYHTDSARIPTAASAPAQLPSPAEEGSLHTNQQGQDRTHGAAPAPAGLMDALSRDGCSMALLAVASALQNALLFSALPFATSVAGSSRGAARAYLYANTLGGIADPIGAGLAAALGAGGSGDSRAGAWAWVWAPGLVAAWVVPSLAVLALAVGPVRGCDYGGGGGDGDGGSPVPPGCVVLAVGVGACFVAARGLLALVRAGAFGRLASMDRAGGDGAGNGNGGESGGGAGGEAGHGLPQAFSRAGGMIMQAAAGCASVAGFLLLTVAGLGVEVSS